MPLLGDPARWRQILTNLIGNAIKFTEFGHVEVRAIPLADSDSTLRCRLEVVDTGIGITQEAQETIFDSFNQADNGTSRKYGGTGLGLTISKQLTLLMGGEIGLTSKFERGSTFWVEIELARAPLQNGLALEEDYAELAGKRILIVEDNEANRIILTEQMRSWGCVTAQATDAYEGLKILRKAALHEQFDMVITDMQMPGMSGLELTKTVAEDAELANNKFIVLSSSSETMIEAEALRLGVVAYLYKPAREALLKKAIQNGLKASPGPLTPSLREGTVTPRHDLRVLLAEDNIVNQKVAVKNLERFGCDVTVVGDGRMALDALQENSFDLVLMDVQMPVMDGIEATTAIRESEQSTGRHQVIIAMTAHAMSGDRERLLNSGMDDYLSKPFDSATLNILLSRWNTVAIKPAKATQVSASASMEVLNESRIAETAGDDPEFAAELFARFVEFADEATMLIENASNASDFKTLAELAHSLKGSSGTIGAERLQAQSYQLELSAKGSDPACGLLVEKVLAEYGILRDRLTAEQAA